MRDDPWLYERLRCDPVMMAELGGPLPKESVPEKLRRDVEAVRRDESWITVIESNDGDAIDTVVLWEPRTIGRLGGDAPPPR